MHSGMFRDLTAASLCTQQLLICDGHQTPWLFQNNIPLLTAIRTRQSLCNRRRSGRDLDAGFAPVHCGLDELVPDAVLVLDSKLEQGIYQ